MGERGRESEERERDKKKRERRLERQTGAEKMAIDRSNRGREKGSKRERE